MNVRSAHGKRASPADTDGSTAGPVDAAILCAGEGKRLRPLTETLPKVLVPVRGKALLDYHVEALYRSGIRRLLIVVGRLGDAIRAHLQTRPGAGLQIEYVTQDPPSGTGDALRYVFPWLQTDPFLLSYGDVFFDDLSAVYSQILTERVPAIVAAQVRDVSRYGKLLVRDEAAQLLLAGVQEKDPAGGTGLVNAGIYLLPTALRRDVQELQASPRGEFELTSALESYVHRGGRLRVLPRDGWADVGTHSVLEELNRAGGKGEPRRGPDV